jgi:hypothetical protein
MLLREFLADRAECSPEVEIATRNLSLLEAETASRGLDPSGAGYANGVCMAEETPESRGNVWPFVGATSSVMARYIDDQVIAVAVNLMLGQLVLGLEGQGNTISVPLSYVSDPGDILPMWPVETDRAAALAKVEEWRPHMRSLGLTPVVLYEGPGGFLWPTHIGPRTAPRIWAVYPAAFEQARQDALATRDAFVQLAFWYVMARFPVRTRTSPREAPAPRAVPSTAAAADVIEGFTAAETAVIREAQSVMGSSRFATIRAAHAAGNNATVTIGGRVIQYQADFTYAEAMTLGREGFVMGPRAFVSEAETARTVLHELHRLHMSSVVRTGTASAASAAQTTRDAWSFAEEAWRIVLGAQ